MALRLKVLPLVLVGLLVSAVLVVPSLALAESLGWAKVYTSPRSHTVNEAEIFYGAAFNAVSFADADNGWAVGLLKDNVYSTGTYTSFIARTSDGGGSWTQQIISPASADELYSVLAVSPSSAWAVGANGKLVKWDGSTWAARSVSSWPAGKALRSIAFSGSAGWAVGDGLGIAVTTDSGATWTTLRAPSGTGVLRSVAAIGDSGTAVAVGDGGRIEYLQSASSAVRTSPTSNILYGVTFMDALHGCAVGASATVVRTSDGGTTWSAVPGVPRVPVVANWDIRAVAFDDASHGMGVGPYNAVWRTSDGGTTWVVEQMPLEGAILDYSLRGVSFAGASPSHPFAVGRANGADTLETPDDNARVYRGTWNRVYVNYQLHYSAGTGGTISGAASQTVFSGGSGTAVTAVPDTGYHFVAWSDGVTTASRTDSGVTGDLTVSASFAVDAYQLHYSAAAGGTISGPASQTVSYNSGGAQVTAIPAAGYHFVAWSDGVTAPARTDSGVTADLFVSAAFAPSAYQLHYSAGAGGTISGTASQTVSYGGSGTAVTAVPSTGYHFVSWSDGVSTAARTDGAVTGNVTAAATFALDTYQLHYTAGAGGSVSGAASQTVPYGGSGTQVTAAPATGHYFLGWSDGVATAARTDSGVVGPISVTALFAVDAPNTYTLAYTAGAGGSIVGASPQTVASGLSGTQVTATPVTGYHFVSWSDGRTTAARTDVNVMADLVVSATFAPNTFELAYTAGSGGTISGAANQTVTYNGSGIAVTAVPATGHHFVRWSDGTTTAARTDTGVTGNVAVSATFALNTYQLHYAADAGGTISGIASQTVTYNGSGTAVTAVPPLGSHFTGWSDGVLTATRMDSGVTGSIAVTAFFAAGVTDVYTLTYTVGAHGTITGTSPQTVASGSDGTPVTAVPAVGYHFVRWSDGVATAARTDTNVTGDISVTANFAANVIHTSLTIYANHSSAARGHLVYFYGTVAPNRPNGTKVEFWVRKAGSATWKRVSLRSTFSSHHWSYSYHPATRGTYYFKVRMWATANYEAGTSRYIKVTWR